MSLRLLAWWPRGSSRTRVPGVEARACPMMCFAPSCRATLLNFLWRQTSGCPKKFASPQVVQCISRSPARVLSGTQIDNRPTPLSLAEFRSPHTDYRLLAAVAREQRLFTTVTRLRLLEDGHSTTTSRIHASNTVMLSYAWVAW